MSDDQDSIDPSEDGTTADSSYSSEAENYDVLQIVISRALSTNNAQLASAASSTQTPAEIPLTSLECAQCKVPVKQQMFMCKSGHLICDSCISYPTSMNLNILPRCLRCDEDAEPNRFATFQMQEQMSKCQYCQAEFRIFYIFVHEAEVCEMRPVSCKYEVGGCGWRGMAFEQDEHESNCTFQHKTGADIIDLLEHNLPAEELPANEIMLLFTQPHCDLINIRLTKKLTPKPTDIDCRFYYESKVFSGSLYLWIIKAKVIERTSQTTILEYSLKIVNYSQADPDPEHDRGLYAYYVALGGPFHIKPKLLEHNFNALNTESAYNRLLEFDEQFKNFEAPITFRLMLATT